MGRPLVAHRFEISLSPVACEPATYIAHPLPRFLLFRLSSVSLSYPSSFSPVSSFFFSVFRPLAGLPLSPRRSSVRSVTMDRD
jgi:hypothetical protein